jgi:methionyl-tRNA formyltransferase
MKRVIFLGSKPIGYDCLEFLLQNQSKFDIEIVGVLTNDNQRFSQEKSIVKLVHDYDVPIIKGLDELLTQADIDFLISVQYHLILKSKHIDVAKILAINLHMAPLPDYRGCNQFSFAIYNQSKEFGTTLHRLEEGIDSGAILAERRFPIGNEMDVKALYDKTVDESLLLFQENIEQVLNGDFELLEQSTFFNSRPHHLYYRKDIESLKRIDLDEPKEETLRKVNATAMPGFDPPFVVHEGKKYYIIPENIYHK